MSGDRFGKSDSSENQEKNRCVAARLFARGRSPAGTCLPTHADRCARLRPTALPPVHPLRSIRRSQGRGVSRPLALWQCAPYAPAARTDGPMPRQQRHPLWPPGCFRIRLRIPPSLSLRDTGASGHPGPRRPGEQTRASSKSDLRNHQAIVQPRLYDCLMVTQITLKTEGPPRVALRPSACGG